MLVRRMVAMVEDGIDISKICAITFTKAAANEFYLRFQRMLYQRANDFSKEEPKAGELGIANDLTRSRCLKALNDIDLCFMGTIDSFCNMVLSEHPASAGIPFDSKVVDEQEINDIYRNEYRRILIGEYGEQLREKAVAYNNCLRHPDQMFVEEIGRIISLVRTNLVREEHKDIFNDQEFKYRQESFLQMVDTLVANEESLKKGDKESQKAADNLIGFKRSFHDTKHWPERISELIRALNDIKKVRLYTDDPKSIGIDHSGFFELKGSRPVYYALNIEDPYYPLNDLKNYQYDICLDFLTDAAKAISEHLKSEGLLTFDDYLYYLRDTLREDAQKGGRLIRHIRERHSYFLIDEFQDTNPIQAEIFFYLSQIKPEKDWSKGDLRDGSLFIVGDPKQSIYRFRNADIKSFNNVKRLFDGDKREVLYLTQNFRSKDYLKQWFNDSFIPMFSNETNIDKCEYLTIPYKQEEIKNDQSVYQYSISEFKQDPEAVSNIIQKMIDEKVMIDTRNGLRPCSYKDFMVITYRKSKLNDYIDAFVRHRIPVKVEGKVNFSQCEILTTTIKVFLALVFYDEIYAYDALRSKAFNLSEKQIYDLKKSTKTLRVTSDIKIADYSPVRLFEKITDEYKIMEICNSDNLEYYYYALELLRKAQSDGTVVNLRDAGRFLLDILQGRSSEERSASFKQDEDVVHLANLHKVKGLERPIVILATSTNQKGSQGDRYRVEYEIDGVNSYAMKIGEIETNNYGEQDEDELRSSECERQRLLYVAATRAAQYLLIGVKLNKGDVIAKQNAWNDLVNNVSYYDISRKTVENKEKEIIDIKQLISQAKERDFSKLSGRQSYEIATPSRISTPGKIEDEVEEAYSITRERALVMGTMAHKLMEILVRSKNDIDLNKAVIRTSNEYADGMYREDLLKLGNSIRSGGFRQENECPKDIL
ncbi:MAG: UvrD-helicase domain-containing protein, partial [Erysipelotrichaceae bacterium]|nr:UvrD-helicase domain-containing protein [Erysipelotrichaceae bacterium]